MSKRNRKRYSSEFKAKVALAALKEDATLSEIAARFEIHPNLVGLWKREAVEGLSSLFTGKANRHEVSQEARIKELALKALAAGDVLNDQKMDELTSQVEGEVRKRIEALPKESLVIDTKGVVISGETGRF